MQAAEHRDCSDLAGAAGPLQATFQRLSALHHYYDLAVGPATDEAWIAVSDLAQPASPALTRALETVAAAYDLDDPQLVVSFFINGHAWLLAAIGLGSLILERRVPDLAPEHVAVRFCAEGYADGVRFTTGRFYALPDDPAADHPEAVVVPDADALLDRFRTQLEAHMAALIPALRARSSFGTRALWVTVADRCAAFLVWLHSEAPALLARERVLYDVPALVRAPGSPLANKLTGTVEVPTPEGSTLALRRGSCCLNYKRSESHTAIAVLCCAASPSRRCC